MIWKELLYGFGLVPRGIELSRVRMRSPMTCACVLERICIWIQFSIRFCSAVWAEGRFLFVGPWNVLYFRTTGCLEPIYYPWAVAHSVSFMATRIEIFHIHCRFARSFFLFLFGFLFLLLLCFFFLLPSFVGILSCYSERHWILNIIYRGICFPPPNFHLIRHIIASQAVHTHPIPSHPFPSQPKSIPYHTCTTRTSFQYSHRDVFLVPKPSFSLIQTKT